MQSILRKTVTSCGGAENTSGSVGTVKTEVTEGNEDSNNGLAGGSKPAGVHHQSLAHTADDESINSDKSRAPNFTTSELTLLLDLINNDYHFAHGNWDKVVDSDTAPGTAQILMRERWMDITNQINAVGGYDREWREVKRKLTTWMSKVKKKAADIAHQCSSEKKASRLPLPRLSTLDQRVLSLLNQDEYELDMIGMLESGVSCELADDGQTPFGSPIGSNVDHITDDLAASDDSAWARRQQLTNARRNTWDHLPRVTDDPEIALFEINKSVKSLVEISEKRIKLEEQKIKIAEEMVQTQKELNANIMKLIQGKINLV